MIKLQCYVRGHTKEVVAAVAQLELTLLYPTVILTQVKLVEGLTYKEAEAKLNSR